MAWFTIFRCLSGFFFVFSISVSLQLHSGAFGNLEVSSAASANVAYPERVCVIKIQIKVIINKVLNADQSILIKKTRMCAEFYALLGSFECDFLMEPGYK